MLCVASSACRAAYPLYFLAGLSALVLLVVSAKLHSIATHLGAMSILDYGDKLDVYVEQQKAGFGGCVMHRGCHAQELSMRLPLFAMHVGVPVYAVCTLSCVVDIVHVGILHVDILHVGIPLVAA